MYRVVFLTILVSHLLITSIAASNCSQNTQLIYGDIFCVCDQNGRWSRNECETIERNYNFNSSDKISAANDREHCLSALRLITTCGKCICLTNGTLRCNFTKCLNERLKTDIRKTNQNVGLIGPWCKPYSSYYINCKICICPSNGNFSQANCIVDEKCKIKTAPKFNDTNSWKNISCVPNIMYVFECLSCVCSEKGGFTKDSCIGTCPNLVTAKTTSDRCTRRTFFRNDCNICFCPENGETIPNLCTKLNCSEIKRSRNGTNANLRSTECIPYHFTKPICHYYGCSPNGTVDTQFQIESACIKDHNINYEFIKDKCTPGEVVPSCKECFCLKNQSISLEFCTEGCSYKAKLYILDKILNESKSMTELIDKNAILNLGAYDNCTQNSIYIDEGKYCVCPENGLTNFKICSTTHIVSDYIWRRPKLKNITIDFNATCKPFTYVEFDCNSCFCSKNGTINPKWCTYDDCGAIKKIRDSQNLVQVTLSSDKNATCKPGVISQSGCNYCICSQSGLVNDSICTKAECPDSDRQVKQDNFLCDPLEYYPVDCNICLCPNDGIKNLAKCTKKACTKSFLRSESCTPGELFSDDCNLCICPESGDKNEKACFHNTCSENSSPWKKIFELTSNLIGKQIPSASKKLEYCFPGEEFVVGCQLCVCPDMGIKSYAICTDTYCEGNFTNTMSPSVKQDSSDETRRLIRYSIRTESTIEIPKRVHGTFPPKRCNPGSSYIIKCQECICPYLGDLNNFCKPLPDEFVCEQEFPYVNYLRSGTMGNRNYTIKGNNTYEKRRKVTKYKCDVKSKYEDECFICKCINKEIELEECYKADKTECKNATATFLNDDDKIIM